LNGISGRLSGQLFLQRLDNKIIYNSNFKMYELFTSKQGSVDLLGRFVFCVSGRPSDEMGRVRSLGGGRAREVKPAEMSHEVWNNPATKTQAAHADMDGKRAAFYLSI
jgi:hypothetical protein